LSPVQCVGEGGGIAASSRGVGQRAQQRVVLVLVVAGVNCGSRRKAGFCFRIELANSGEIRWRSTTSRVQF